MEAKIAVIGAGSWGTAIAALLARKNYTVKLWGRDESLINEISAYHKNPRYLTDLSIPSSVTATNNMEEALLNVNIVVLAVPSHTVRSIISSIKDILKPNMLIISLAKGIEVSSLMRMSEVIIDVLPEEFHKNIGVLSGPNHAEEVSKDIPSATVVSAVKKEVALKFQYVFMTPYFRVYINPDLAGVELGGATKNVVAIAAGVSDGLGYGDNTKASLITRGLAEMTRLGIILKANPLTFSGLSGMGDLIVTCTSNYSRNRAVGEKLASGKTIEDIAKETTMIAEGVITSKAVDEMARKYNIEMPITKKVVEIIYENKDPHRCVSELMERGPAEEIRWET
ncbi:MAG: NAD(P)H-dependent glycerol-3-phosphate dehydrogenase [Actinobacteria bacterium]|nr:NAD(P)H-dependent glycerol-3-phosphate dehydrogenase [Actinomycetota bacterium]